jgi:hypothetical protein
MLDHANHLVTLPPTASSAEIQLIAEFLNAESIIDWEFPEIQMCMSGRMNIGNCGILGSSIMWLTDANVPYNQDSFDTTHFEQTAFRIMIYDANGYRNEFPFDIARDRGRTDMLGRRTLKDFIPWQILGSVLSYSEEPLDDKNTSISREHLEEFHRLAEQYKRGYKHILSKYGFSGVLGELWLNPVYLEKEGHDFLSDKNGGIRHFKKAVKPIMDEWNRCAKIAENTGEMPGIMGAMEGFYDSFENNVRNLQKDMLKSSHYQEHRDLLFNLDP